MNPVEIFSGTILQAGMLQSMLSDAGIESYLKDENIGTLMPWVSSPGGANPVKVQVAEQDYERAILIVEEFENNNNQ
jgi:hypothetical protein